MNWVFGRTYVYYIAELDALYTASYLPMPPKHPLTSVGYKFFTLRNFGKLVRCDGVIYFSPNVVALVHKKTQNTHLYQAILIGEL